MNEYQKRFIALLKTIFELDKSDLDFGIYRIMNIRQREIIDYFENHLPNKIKEILTPFVNENANEIRQKMAKIEADVESMGMTIASLQDNTPKKQEYITLQKQLSQGTDISALESDVYSALYSFFNRYYDEGDFISKRRYKEGVYAIPYEGEEVKLYWANQDQYYIKTAENFKDYTFVTEEGINVHFRLVDATVEQNNNKETDDSKRVFMLYTENKEQPELKTFEWDAEKRELIIRFIFDIPADKKKNYNDDNYTKILDYIIHVPELIGPLMHETSTDPKKSVTLIQKHLNGYVAKNTFDYFIHKDLGGFLSRELDFFIKNEVMHIDDLDTDDEVRAESYLAKVRAVKRIGKEIITFLAQIENFQRKLWLKKKFVVETNWCITLDHIDESFYQEIIDSKLQIQEWLDMYAIDEIEGDSDSTAFTNPLSIDFLKENQNLIVDTKNFPATFRDRLIASIDNIDEKTNGLMINSDNFHAINLLSKKESEKIDCIYIDPPYNTDASKILYKNGYEHSSWLSLINSRLINSKHLLKDSGIIEVAIDDYEMRYLSCCLDNVYGVNNAISNIAIFTNPKGRDQGFIAQAHDYSIIYAKNKQYATTYNFKLSDKELAKKFSRVKDGISLRELPLKRTGTGKFRENRPFMFFPFFYHPNTKDFFVIPKESYDNIYDKDSKTFNDKYLENIINDYSQKGYYAILPVSSRGEYLRWRWGYESCVNGIADGTLFCKEVDDGYAVYQYDAADNEVTPKSIWVGDKYDASSKGTNILNSIIPNNPFDYPKSLYTVEDNIIVGSSTDGITFDFFAGSGTTGHAVIDLNRKDNGHRKYILVEMGEYFNSATKPRIKKVIYSPNWKDGKPINRNKGVSQIMKYMRLESYEDALSNISLEKKDSFFHTNFGDEYLIGYMLDMEAKGSLLNLDAFITPFEYNMRITEKNECKERQVDVVETFNYLIGLSVHSQSAISYFSTKKAINPSYEKAVDLQKDLNGVYGFRQIEGTLPDGRRALIIWRNINKDNLLASNAALDAYFLKYRINPDKRDFDVIYINGDNNIENLRLNNEHWKVVLTETEFNKGMWEE